MNPADGKTSVNKVFL